MSVLVDVAGVVAAFLREHYPNVPRYFHGPNPDFGERMIVFQVIEPRPVGAGSRVWEAVEFNLFTHVFHRDREAAVELANTVCQDLHEAYWGGELVSVKGDGKFRFSFVEMIQFPQAENDNLVNDQQIFRFDSHMRVIVRRA